MDRLEHKRFWGQQWHTEERTLQFHHRAERDAVIRLALRFLESLPDSKSLDVGRALLFFFKFHEISIPTQAARFVQEYCHHGKGDTLEPVPQGALQTIVRELRQLNPQPPRDAMHKRLTWISGEAGLTDLDQSILGVLIRARMIDSYAFLLASLSPFLHDPRDVHLLSLMAATGRSRRELRARLRGKAPLIVSGLVRDVKDNEFEATPFAIQLARLRSSSPRTVTQAFRMGLEDAVAEPRRVYTSGGYRDDEDGMLVYFKKSEAS